MMLREILPFAAWVLVTGVFASYLAAIAYVEGRPVAAAMFFLASVFAYSMAGHFTAEARR